MAMADEVSANVTMWMAGLADLGLAKGRPHRVHIWIDRGGTTSTSKFPLNGLLYTACGAEREPT